MEQIVIEWDGNTLPEQLKELAPGQYILYPVDDGCELTTEEDAGIRQALDEAEQGLVMTLDELIAEFKAESGKV